MKLHAFVTICVFTLALKAQPLDKLPPEAVSIAAGRVVTVCGLVVELGCHSPDSAASLTFVTSKTAPVLTIAVPSDAAVTDLEFVDQHTARPVCVTGLVQPNVSGYQIAVSALEDIAPEASSATPPVQRAERLYRSCELGVAAPILRQDVKPHYTADAMRRKVSGRVWLQGVVGKDGRVHDVQVLRSLDDSLDRAAENAARQWRFEPGRYDGTPVSTIVTFDMHFTLK